MVGYCDHHGVNVLPIQNAAIVLIDVGLTAQTFPSHFSHFTIHIAHGHDIAQRQGVLRDDGTLVSQAYRSDAEPVTA